MLNAEYLGTDMVKEKMVYIKNLYEMEEIVKSKKVLYWEGWDVVKVKPKPTAYMNKDAKFMNGEWHECERFPLTEHGWYVPETLQDMT